MSENGQEFKLQRLVINLRPWGQDVEAVAEILEAV
jgi:hypothetical protein